MIERHPPKTFRQALFVVFAVALFCSLPVKATATRQLRLLTSFPPRFYTPFVEQFEKRHPDIAVSILNKKTTAAIDEILRGNSRRFDLFWSSSVDAFDLLKSKQMLKRIEPRFQTEAVAPGDISLNDPDGYFYGFAISAIGWMWNNGYLERQGLPVPSRWEDLENPVYYGHLAMSTPSRSGTTHLIVENILQNYGWDAGWAYLMRISGNFATITARSFGVFEGVESNRFGIGLVIDFLARTGGNPAIGFTYGKPAFPVPAGIAELHNAKNHENADLFISFILSEEGQRILLDPDINRLPINRNLLLEQKDKVARLLQLIGGGEELRSYDVSLSRQRYNLVNSLFDQLITFHLRERRQIWKRLITLKKQAGDQDADFRETEAAVLKLITANPVSRQASLDPELNEILGHHHAFGQDAYDRQRAVIDSWDDFVIRQTGQARRLLDRYEQHLAKPKKQP